MKTNTVKDGIYYARYGEPISIGRKIKLNFAGGPCDMPGQWILVEVSLYFSTVSWSYQVKLKVRAENGNEKTYFPAEHYSPYGENHEEYFNKFLKG